MSEFRIETGERYRIIDQKRIIELLLGHGWAFELRAGQRAEAERAAHDTLDRMIALGLPYRQLQTGGRRFDPSEVVNFAYWASTQRGDATWERHFVATARRLVWEMHGGSEEGKRPPPISSLGPQRHFVTLRRTFHLADREPGERVRLRLPLPIEDAYLRNLQIRLAGQSVTPLHSEINPARLDIVIETPPGREATFSIEAEFTAHPWGTVANATPLPAEEFELYTRANEGLIKISERVAALADALAGDESDPKKIARKYWTFLLDRLAMGVIHHDRLDPAAPLDWIIENRWSDCQVGSALLAALCRARKIPARLVTGFILYRTAPGLHTWLEIWFDDRGWMPFDLFCWELSAARSDDLWRDHYCGQLDYRMATERPPRLFNGAGSVRLPKTWHCLTACEEAGVSVTFVDGDTGALVYRDHITVARRD
jgi:hypothetical protein